MVKQKYTGGKTLRDLLVVGMGIALVAGGLPFVYLGLIVSSTTTNRATDFIVAGVLFLVGLYALWQGIYTASGGDYTCSIQQDTAGVTFVQDSGKRLHVAWDSPSLKLTLSDQSHRPPGVGMRVDTRDQTVQLFIPGKVDWMAWIDLGTASALLGQARAHGLAVTSYQSTASVSGRSWPVERTEIRPPGGPA